MENITVLVVLTLFGFSASLTTYEGYKVYKVNPDNQEHVNVLEALQNDDDLDFWSDLRDIGDPVDVMVPPNKQQEFETLLRNNEMEFSEMIEDVQRLINVETEQQAKAKAKPRSSTRWVEFDQYYSHNEINEYLAYLASKYPSLVTLEDIGRSLEGRGMIFAKISTNPAAGNPIVLIDGGIHAREWIAPAAVLYILDQLLENAHNSYLLQGLDWYILPVLNPDGYEFSRTSTRLWRKTRSEGATCYGTDGNRNFDYYWASTGSSSNECSETYHGPSPNSEVETRNFIQFTTPYASRIKLYLTYHSYGDYFLYPVGFSTSPVENREQLQALGDAAAAAIEAINGRRYTVGQSSTTLYATSGSSRDYVYGTYGAPLVYTVELSGDSYGFVWPPENINQTVTEVWASVLVFAQYVSDNYAKK